LSGWLPFERRWRDRLVAAILPGDDDRATTDAFWPYFDAQAPTALRRGFRLAVWTFTLLPATDRHERLRRAQASRSLILRELLDVARLVACLALVPSMVER
jgi:hypothetical protein